MPTQLTPPGPWTADMLSHFPESRHLVEVINGHLHCVYANDDSHSLAVWSLALLVAPFAWGLDFDFVLGPKPFRLSPHSQVQPDLLVLPRRGAAGATHVEQHVTPELVVEVATPYSRDVDGGIKQRLYEASGVFAYWVVDYAAREVVVWRGPRWRSAYLTESLSWTPRHPHDAELTIDLGRYFDALPEFDFSFDQSGPWVRRMDKMMGR